MYDRVTDNRVLTINRYVMIHHFIEFTASFSFAFCFKIDQKGENILEVMHRRLFHIMSMAFGINKRIASGT